MNQSLMILLLLKQVKIFFLILLVEKAIKKVFDVYSNIVNYSEEENNEE